MTSFRAWGCVVLLACLLGFASPLFAANEGTFTAEVPSGRWKTVRVRNLPAAAMIGVEATSTGAVGIAFLDETDFKSFPAVSRPLFQGQFEQSLSFSVTIATPGDYYVLLDNRTGGAARQVTVKIKGSRGPTKRSRVTMSPESIEKFQASLDEFQRKLGRIFIFEAFPMKIQTCGVAQAFASEKGIVLCTEYAVKLYETLADKEKASNALLFTVFHEVGHTLLAQWKSPVYDNEEVADEFATAAMILLGQKDRVRAKAEFFAAQPARAESLTKMFKDDRHPLSVQRARNILRWSRDPNLLRKWQTVFIPRMQTATLEQLKQKPPAWADPVAIEKELAGRR